MFVEKSVLFHIENVWNFCILNKSADKGLSSRTLSNLRALRSPCEY